MASASGHFIAKDDLERVVSGAPLTGNMVFSASDFWETEQRIGLGRTEERTAKDGALYTTSHIRLHDKQEEVDIVVGVAGFEDLHRPEGLYTYGGEGRLAYIAPIDVPSDSLFFPNAVKDEAKKATFAVALSPVYLESTAENAATNLHVLPDMACQINGTVANILTCCTKEPLSFGGWDSKSWQGTQIRSYIPAGTVLFFKDPLPFAPATWGEMGNNAECGFGSLLFGTLFNG
jgi:CRISPR type III-B/RAMP module-associated protein Cmr3